MTSGSATTQRRQIGPRGTAVRALAGVALFLAAYFVGLRPATFAIGLLAAPAAVTLVLLVRGRRAPPLRAHAGYWHCLNIAAGVLFFSLNESAALLFYGVSMLVAAWRGLGACELLAISNVVLGRDDQLACPIFLPVDIADARSSGRELYC